MGARGAAVFFGGDAQLCNSVLARHSKIARVILLRSDRVAVIATPGYFGKSTPRRKTCAAFAIVGYLQPDGKVSSTAYASLACSSDYSFVAQQDWPISAGGNSAEN